METPTLMLDEESKEVTPWEEEDLYLLAMELWQRASAPKAETDRAGAKLEPWCHASCL